MKVLDQKSNFLALQGAWGSLEQAEVAILPAPYERTSSYVQGSFRGPRAILEASSQLEEFDEELAVEIFPLCQGIATLEPMLFVGDPGQEAVRRISAEVDKLVGLGKYVICLGGEHTCGLGPMRVWSERCPEKLSVLQLDAHSDLRDSYRGDTYSHACVMARALEFVPAVVQLGIRATSKDEAVFERSGRVTSFYAQPIKTGQLPDWQDRVLDSLTETVYLTIDCDYFDPSVIPSVGTPEPGGFLWYETLAFLRRLCSEKTVVGFDLCEFVPIDRLWYPDFALARLIYKLIGYIWTARR
jgi:agmatinase